MTIYRMGQAGASSCPTAPSSESILESVHVSVWLASKWPSARILSQVDTMLNMVRKAGFAPTTTKAAVATFPGYLPWAKLRRSFFVRQFTVKTQEGLFTSFAYRGCWILYHHFMFQRNMRLVRSRTTLATIDEWTLRLTMASTSTIITENGELFIKNNNENMVIPIINPSSLLQGLTQVQF